MTNRAEVWQFFEKSANVASAKCKRCSKTIKTTGGSTKGLHTHLRTIHNIDTRRKDDDETTALTSQPETKKRKLTDFFATKDDNSLQAMVSRMVARDGFPFKVFVTSNDLRSALRAKGFELPKSEHSFRKMTMDYAMKIRSYNLQEIQQEIKEGRKFSVSFDEWTSIRGRRYMNVNVHGNSLKFWNLGLVRILGSMPAEVCVDLLKKRLEKYSLCLTKDIVCIVTDGASVMVKVGKLIAAEQQLCLVHGIQLAVLDVLYKKKLVSENESEQVEINTDVDEEQDQTDDEEDISFQDECGVTIVNRDNEADLLANISPLIDKVRRIVRMFKRSPTKNDILQKYILEDHGKELKLLLDCRTRWSSLFTMLERFNLVKYSIQKCLIDLKSPFSFTDEELQSIIDNISALQPVKLTVEVLCRKDSNLLTATTAMQFMIQTLDKNESSICKKMSDALKIRIKERLRPELSGILHYLHNPSSTDEDFELFEMPSKLAIRKILQNFVERLCVSIEASTTEPLLQDDPPENSNIPPMQQQLQLAIEKALSKATTTPSANNLNLVLRREMALYEGGGALGFHLKMVYNFLLTIPPTSVDSERAFSAAGILCTKFRSRLNDDTVDALCFLRGFFQQQAMKMK